MKLIFRCFPSDSNSVAWQEWAKHPQFMFFVNAFGQIAASQAHAILATPAFLTAILDAKIDGRGVLNAAQAVSVLNLYRINAEFQPDEDALVAVIVTGPERDPSVNVGPSHLGNRLWEIPWVELIAKATQLSAPTLLLCEDLDDAKLLAQLSEIVSIAGEPDFFEMVRLSPRAGGGENTSKVLEATVKDGGPVVCVVDSDKQWPEGSIGSVAKGVTKVVGKHPSELVGLPIKRSRATAVEILFTPS